MKQIASIPVRYRYAAAGKASVDLRYRYTAWEALVASLDVVRAYRRDEDLDRIERQVGFWSWATQDICNRFPRWHQARHSIGGTTQQYMNAFGIAMSDVLDKTVKVRRGMFLSTADASTPSVFHHAPVVNFDQSSERVVNLLQNPCFGLKTLARFQMPAYWRKRGYATTGTVQAVSQPALTGSESVLMHAATGEHCHLVQDLQVPVASGIPLTFSFWYLSPQPAGTVLDERDCAVVFTIFYSDGTAEMHRKAVPVGTAGKWRRVHLTVTTAKSVFTIRVGAALENDSGKTIRLYVSSPQLELGSTAHAWANNPAYVQPWIPTSVGGSPVDASLQSGATTTSETINGETISYGRRSTTCLFHLADEDFFWELLWPTRVSAVATTDVSSTNYNVSGAFHSPEGESFVTAWKISGTKIVQYNAEIPAEIVGEFDLAEMYMDEYVDDLVGIATDGEDPGFSRTLEQLCIHRGFLYVLCKETLNSVTRRVLKIVQHRSRWPLPHANQVQGNQLYLDVIADVEVPLSTGSATFLGVDDSRANVLQMTVGGTVYDLFLKYDFYLFDFERRQVVMHNSADNQLVTV